MILWISVLRSAISSCLCLCLSDCRSTVMTALWCVPKTDGAQQDGRCCSGNRSESGEDRSERSSPYPPSLPHHRPPPPVGSCSDYREHIRNRWRGQVRHRDEGTERAWENAPSPESMISISLYVVSSLVFKVCLFLCLRCNIHWHSMCVCERERNHGLWSFAVCLDAALD